jgi:uncharacterized protein
VPLSRYLKCFPEPEKSDSFILYSTKKGSSVRVSRAFLSGLENGIVGEAERDTLRRLEIWTDDVAAERRSMAALVERTNADSTSFSATVALTMNCNLACSYCFEDHFRAGQNMTAETADRLIDYVVREQIERGREVEIRFYGGEPLLALPILKRIAGVLGERAQAAGTKFSCSMVSNATLLNRQVVEELLPYGLTSVQITLDGPPEIHNSQRPFVSGKGSFATILANLLEVYELVTLKPGGNFTRDNYRAFPAALDAMLEAGIDPAKVGAVQFGAVHPKAGGYDPQGAGCFANDEPWLSEAQLYLREETIARGFKVDPVAMGICSVELTDNLVVNWDGSLYKCPVFMGWPELSIGNLTDGIDDYSQSHKLGLWQNDECLDCAYLPLCFGGCRLIPKLNHGVIDRVNCRRNHYDQILPALVLQDLRAKAMKDPMADAATS